MKTISDIIINQATRQFISEHADDDVHTLALARIKNSEIDMQMALNQIAGRQYAKGKLPSWAASHDIIYPPHLAMEQCSSEFTARYKASLVSGNEMVDLTGGMGVDCHFISQNFNSAVYIEQNTQLCNIAKHNFNLLNNDKITVVNGDGVEFLQSMKHTSLIFIDPARRDTAGRRTYGIEHCTPDVTRLASLMLEKADKVMIKLSPMLDVSHTINALPSVTQVHIVSTANECKELLVILDSSTGTDGDISIHCVNDDSTFTFYRNQASTPAQAWDETFNTPLYLYEPNASVMKAGCFNLLAKHFGMHVVSHDSHLLISDKYTDKFPGRAFAIDKISSLNKSEIRHALKGIANANVAVRNFPLRANELAKRLHIKDGGDNYLFGTTTASGKRIILMCHKIV